MSPPDDDAYGEEARGPVFHVGCGTLSLAALVGYPLGALVASLTIGKVGLGGFIGAFVMMFVFGFINQRARLAGPRGFTWLGPLGSRQFWGPVAIAFLLALFMPWSDMFTESLSWVPIPAGIVIGLVRYQRAKRAAPTPRRMQ